MAKSKEATVATKTKPTTKSAKAREMFAAGKTVTEVAAQLHIGYAFAYGIAKRAGVAGSAANRRKSKTVTITDTGSVRVVTTAGIVTVAPDGKVTRTKV